jgi:hypothetical protein
MTSSSMYRKLRANKKPYLLEFWRNIRQLLVDVLQFILNARNTEFASSLSGTKHTQFILS